MDTDFDIVTLAHKKALKCAEAHRKIVTDNFDHLYDLLVSSFDDDRFCKRITSLKRGGRATVSIPLKPEDEKIWGGQASLLAELMMSLMKQGLKVLKNLPAKACPHTSIMFTTTMYMNLSCVNMFLDRIIAI